MRIAKSNSRVDVMIGEKTQTATEVAGPLKDPKQLKP